MEENLGDSVLFLIDNSKERYISNRCSIDAFLPVEPRVFKLVIHLLYSRHP